MSDRPDPATSRLAVTIATITLLTAGLAYLQADAAARDDRANRDSKRYATEAMGRNIAGDAQTNFDYYTAFAAWREFDQLAEFAGGQGDPRARTRYATMRDRMTRLSPMLTPPYLDAKTGEVDSNRWQAERYVEEVAALDERFLAASGVKEAWDHKANTYIVHLTLMAAALALLGLSTTVPGPKTRTIVSRTGIFLSGVAVLWATATAIEAVPDLRDKKGAIEAYAKGMGRMHQERWPDAVKEFSNAVQAAPEYGRALALRGFANFRLEKRAEAARDYEMARELGERSGASTGMLAWLYYEQGRFDDAIAMSHAALEVAPDELWVRFGLGLAQLAAGKKDDALATFKAATEHASQVVEHARAAGQEAPSVVWYSLDDAVGSLLGLWEASGGGGASPPREKIANPTMVAEVVPIVAAEISGLAVSLEYSGKPPGAAPAATLDNVRFAPVDEQGRVGEEGVAFEAHVHNVEMRFDFKGMKDGSQTVFKVYHGALEAAEWRLVEPWKHGAEGTLATMVAADGGDFAPGDYSVVGFVDAHFATWGTFTIKEPK